MIGIMKKSFLAIAIAAAVSIALIVVLMLQDYEWKVVEKHDKTPEFTQGLEFVTLDGSRMLGETSGLQGRSKVMLRNPVSPQTPVTTKPLPMEVFGEGFTQTDDGAMLAGTRKHRTLYYLDKDLNLTRMDGNSFNVWGMCTDFALLWVTDGTPVLKAYDPANNRLVKSVPLKNSDGKPLMNANEIECMEDNAILTNEWKTNNIHRIDLETGQVTRTWDLTSLAEEQKTSGSLDSEEDVLNGIAVEPGNQDRVWVTGKNWKNFYVLDLNY